MIVKRCSTAGLVLGLGLLLGSCGGMSEPGFSGYVADHWPHWAGGMPADVPPRPGAPGYDEFIAHGQANQDAAKPSASDMPAPQFVATGSTPSGAKATPGAAKVRAHPAPAAPVEPVEPVEPSENGPSPDSSVVNGGLY